MTNTPNDPTRPGSRDVHGSSTVTPVPATKKSRPWWLWLIPLVLLGLLFLALRSCGDDEETTTTTTDQTTTTTQPGATTTPAAASPALPVERVTLPGGRSVEMAPNTLNYELQQYLASPAPAPRRFTFDGLNFATGSAEMPADAQATTAALAQILQSYPNARVRIEGYADARGSEGANAQLGARRAETVATALINAGVQPARVTAASGGESNPVDTNATTQGQAENRRTDLVVTAK
jgi:outer membrane protein OmpA-like peptidoglycan-associated protein